MVGNDNPFRGDRAETDDRAIDRQLFPLKRWTWFDDSEPTGGQ